MNKGTKNDTGIQISTLLIQPSLEICPCEEAFLYKKFKGQLRAAPGACWEFGIKEAGNVLLLLVGCKLSEGTMCINITSGF